MDEIMNQINNWTKYNLDNEHYTSQLDLLVCHYGKAVEDYKTRQDIIDLFKPDITYNNSTFFYDKEENEDIDNPNYLFKKDGDNIYIAHIHEVSDVEYRQDFYKFFYSENELGEYFKSTNDDVTNWEYNEGAKRYEVHLRVGSVPNYTDDTGLDYVVKVSTEDFNNICKALDSGYYYSFNNKEGIDVGYEDPGDYLPEDFYDEYFTSIGAVLNMNPDLTTEELTTLTNSDNCFTTIIIADACAELNYDPDLSGQLMQALQHIEWWDREIHNAAELIEELSKENNIDLSKLSEFLDNKHITGGYIYRALYNDNVSDNVQNKKDTIAKYLNIKNTSTKDLDILTAIKQQSSSALEQIDAANKQVQDNKDSIKEQAAEIIQNKDDVNQIL